jgi:hypothetical protein
MERALIVDGRNTLTPEEVTSHNFQYVGIGGVARMPEGAPSFVSDPSATTVA